MTMNETSYLWHNINNTDSVIDLYGSYRNLLCYNESFNLCGGISSEIRSNNNDMNITILANDSNIFLNDFNLTENVEINHTPLWIETKTISGNIILYHLDSNLTDSINVSFYPSNVPCPYNLVFKPNSTSLTHQLNFSCSGGYLVEVNVTEYEPGIGSNDLYVYYDVGDAGGGGGTSPSSWYVTEWNGTNNTLEVIDVECGGFDKDKDLFMPWFSTYSFPFFNLSSCEDLSSLDKYFVIEEADGKYRIIGIEPLIFVGLILVIYLGYTTLKKR